MGSSCAWPFQNSPFWTPVESKDTAACCQRPTEKAPLLGSLIAPGGPKSELLVDAA